MAVPTRHRDALHDRSSGQLVATVDIDEKCLLLYPLGEWEEIERKIMNLPSFDHAARRVQRILVGHATDVELDANGRMLIPSLLRDYAEINKKVILVGQGKKFEIWSEECWNRRRDVWLHEDKLSSDSMPDEMRNISL